MIIAIRFQPVPPHAQLPCHVSPDNSKYLQLHSKTRHLSDNVPQMFCLQSKRGASESLTPSCIKNPTIRQAQTLNHSKSPKAEKLAVVLQARRRFTQEVTTPF